MLDTGRELAAPEPRRVGGALLTVDVERVGRYAAQATSDNTRRAYASDWRAWAAWCARRDTCPLPGDPLDVAAHLADLADCGASPATVQRRLSGIGDAHRRAEVDNPAEHAGVRKVLRGIRRSAVHAGYRPRQATALDVPTLRALVDDLPLGLAGVRDRAMLLTAFALGLRSSDVVGLDVGDVTPAAHGSGLDILIRWSKGDPLGEGETLALAKGVRPSTDPVGAVNAWLLCLTAEGVVDGPLFRAIGKGRTARLSTRRMATASVTGILRRAAASAGVAVTGLSSHSARRGYATSAYAAGVPERDIAATGRWRSLIILRHYDAAGRWSNPASSHLGL